MKPIPFASAGRHPFFGRPLMQSTDNSYIQDSANPSSSGAHTSTSMHPEQPGESEAAFCSPPFNTFAFQAPRHSPPSQYHPLVSDAEGERYPTASTSYYRDQPSTAASTVSSFGLRPVTMSTRRPSTGATSIAAHMANEHLGYPKAEVAEMACVKNLIGALTTNGHKLKAPGETGLGIFFVFHDLRYVLGV